MPHVASGRVRCVLHCWLGVACRAFFFFGIFKNSANILVVSAGFVKALVLFSIQFGSSRKVAGATTKVMVFFSMNTSAIPTS